MPAPTADDHAFAKAGLLRSQVTPALTVSRDLSNADSGKTLPYAGADPITLTAPTGVRPGFACRVVQLGAGAVTIAAGAGASLVTALSSPATTGAGSFVDVNGVSQPGASPIFAVLAGGTGGAAGPTFADALGVLLYPDILVRGLPTVGAGLDSGYPDGAYVLADGSSIQYEGDAGYEYTANSRHYFDWDPDAREVVITVAGATPPLTPGFTRMMEVRTDSTEITDAYPWNYGGIILKEHSVIELSEPGCFIDFTSNRSRVLGKQAGTFLIASAPLDSVPPGHNCLIDCDNTALTGVENTLIGGGGSSLTTGSSNIAIGPGALSQAVGQNQNAAIGHLALNFSTGTDGTGIGYRAGWGFTIGQGNTAIGSFTQGLDSPQTGDNNTVIGYLAKTSALGVSNEVTLGNADVTALRCAQTSITAISDERDKADIVSIPRARAQILLKALQPVHFRWDMRHEEGEPQPKAGILDSGFTAQNLREAQEAAGIADYARFVYDANPERLEATYSRLLPYLVQIIKDQQAAIEALNIKVFGDGR